MPQFRRTAALTAIAALVAALSDLRAQPGGHADAQSTAGQTAAAAVPGVDGPLGTVEADTPAAPWEGGPGTARTTDDVMSRVGDRWGLASPTLVGLLDLTPALPNVTVLEHGPNAEPDTNALRPDTSGDVGPTQYLLAVNGRIRTHAKATGAADGVLDSTLDEFFASARNGKATSTPRVRFDRRAGRWIVLAITTELPNRYLVAVSSTATITGGTSWAFLLPWSNTRTQGGVGGADACLGDDATLSLDGNAIYIGVNQRCGPGLQTLAFDSTTLYVVRRSDLLQGAAVVSQFDGLVATPASQGIYAPQGALNFDLNPTHGFVIGVDNLLKDRLLLRRVTNPGAVPTLSSDVVFILDFDLTGTPIPTGNPIDVPHPGSTRPLDGLDRRLSQAVVRNGRLWTSHHFEVNEFGEMEIGGGRNGIRWYELDNLSTTPTLVQAGTVWHAVVSNPESYWNSSIMLNGQGHAALGMSIAGPLRHVGAAFTGRLAGDPLEAMDAPTIYSDPHSFTYNLQGAPALEQPWGRTSSTSVDPDDDMTMWTLQQFVDDTDSYGLRLVKIQAPAPAEVTSLSPGTLASGLTGATVTVNALGTGGTGFFDPGPGFARRITAAFSGLGVTVTAVNVVTPTRLRLTVNTTGALPGSRALTVTNPDGQTRQLASALTITAAPANGPPVAANDSGSTPFGAVLNAPAPGVLANDTDPEGQPLTAQLVTSTSNGSLTLNANGSLIYSPNAGFTGTDSFTYRAFDGALQSNVATATISVGVNRAPVFGVVPGNRTLFDPGTGVSSGPLAFTVIDPDGTPLSVSAVSSNTAVIPAGGVVLSGSGANGAVTISTAGATSLGSSTITLTASDGSLTVVASFVITVMTSTVPGAPQNLVGTVSRNTVLFTWQAPSTAATEPVQTYVLDAGLAPGTTVISLPLGNVLSFATMAPDGVFYVRVRAVTPAGSGPVSNEVLVTIGQSGPPLPPLSLLATVQGTAVTLAWTENPLGPVITSYQIQAGTAAGLVDVGVIPLPPAARTLVVDAPPGTYFVRIVALNAAGASAPSNEAVITAGAGICTIPAVPTGLVASSAGGVISVQWSPAAAGAIPLGYVLQAGSIPGGADRATLALPATTTAVGGPVPAGPYFIRVAAGNACGVSAPSAEVSVVVP